MTTTIMRILLLHRFLGPGIQVVGGFGYLLVDSVLPSASVAVVIVTTTGGIATLVLQNWYNERKTRQEREEARKDREMKAREVKSAADDLSKAYHAQAEASIAALKLLEKQNEELKVSVQQNLSAIHDNTRITEETKDSAESAMNEANRTNDKIAGTNERIADLNEQLKATNDRLSELRRD